MRIAIALAISTLVLPLSALAQPDRLPLRATPTPAADVSGMVTDDCAAARRLGKTCVLVVPPEDVQGDAPAAGDVDVWIVRFGTAASLIRLRRDFIPEIVRTGEAL